MTWQRRYNNGPRAAGVLLRAHSTGRVLLLQAPSGMWELPGGKIEYGETPRVAAVRELHEETGIEAFRISERSSRTSPSYELFFGSVQREVKPLLSEHDAFKWSDPRRPPAPLHPGLWKVFRS